MKIKLPFKSPELKALPKLVKEVCEFEGQVMWDIILNPYKPHDLGWFSYNDGGRKIELDELHNFIVTKYWKSLQYYDSLYVIIDNDGYCIFVQGTPDKDHNYIMDDSGLYISRP